VKGISLFRATFRVALAAVLGVLAPTSLALPVLAASPNVQVTVTVSPSPSVSPSTAILFTAQVTYDGSSMVNRVNAASSAPGATFLRSWVNGVPCDKQTCSLGSFSAPHASAQLLFLYQAPVSGGVSVTGTVTVTTGEGPNDSSNASHQDTFADDVTIPVEDQLDLGIATLLPDSVYPGLATVDTGLGNLGSGNPHGTQLTFPGAAAQGTLATIQDVDANCPAFFKSAAKCFGQGSYLSVPNVDPADPYLKVTAAWSAAELRKGVTEKTIQIVHIFGSTAQVISKICSSTPPDTTELPCRTVGTVATDGTVSVTLYLKHNGLIKGW
jgi:hypothetical protein